MVASQPHLSPPFRADHIGSLKRPAKLLAKRKEFDENKCSAEELRVVEDEAIAAIVEMQREAGIKSITDGEFKRHMFYDGVFDNLDGMKFIPVVPIDWFMDYVPDVDAFKKHNFKGAPSYICESKLKRTKPFYVGQYEALKALTKPEEHKNLKITMCAPEWFHLRHGSYAYPKSVYPTDEEYFADVVKAYREEIQDLYQRGCRNIQFDDPLLAYFCSDKMLQGMEEQGVDHKALLALYVKVYNDIIADHPADMTVGIHLCRGNFRGGRHFSEGGYDRIAIALFKDIAADTYYLEYDTERAGTFEPLRWLPPNKSVVLGIVSSKLPALEDKDEVVKKVHAAAEVIANGEEKRPKEEALNQICISPQCGFASHSDGNPVSEDDVVKKLSLVTDIAKAIWTDV
ncbi:hypothetical protein FOMPIDRAFT_1024052 [Fomitopsis schrenkii]|uniref:Cobalamin-independent methionine synthase MetE C-terminal/archaeal domain-containing protein n=1 Tax=Fomitopsis schrenkii TaxID=2126942 RepID=S8FE31_FOMSC|nr:hypothetical protein FOMPIDRAFT_1024052 [Fomitopsis schrenkii]